MPSLRHGFDGRESDDDDDEGELSDEDETEE